jgi:hypothetical protein
VKEIKEVKEKRKRGEEKRRGKITQRRRVRGGAQRKKRETQERPKSTVRSDCATGRGAQDPGTDSVPGAPSALSEASGNF